MSTDTPFLRQYRSVKEQHPDKVLFFRMGDFYEMFYADAERVAALLGLSLTRRKTKTDSVPMAGVPVHTVDQYLSRLVRLGESVAICEQVGQPGKGLMERRVSRIVTPGTLTDESLLTERASCIAMSCQVTGGECGYAWLDLARGELRAGQCPAGALQDHVARLEPAELLLPEGLAVPPGCSMAVRHLPAWEFDAASARHRLLDRFQVTDLAGFGLDGLPHAVGCASALLGYAEGTQCQRLEHLWRIGVESQSEHVAMDATARGSLEITTSASKDGLTLMGVLDTCLSAMGSRLLARRLHNPIRDVGELSARLDACEDAAAVAGKAGAWLSGCCDMERIVTRVVLGNVRPRELAALRDALASLPGLQAVLGEGPERLKNRFATLLVDQGAVEGLLSGALAREPSASVSDGGVIADGHDAGLDELRKLRSGATGELKSIEAAERARTGLDSLRVSSNRVHGRFIEVPRSRSDDMPTDYRRIQTTKHTERFTTPSLRELEVRIARAEEETLALEAKLFADLVVAASAHVGQLRSLAEAAADLDVSIALSGHADKLGWCRPEFVDEAAVAIGQGRHPVVESAVPHFVPNDTALGPQARMEVVTGPNMGGKSTYMRQVALIVLMAHIGSPVPAASAKLGPVDAIMTRIGASDDIAGGRSTFMVEMTETAAILNTAGPNSLVILDEIGRGTSTYDGLSIAWAVAQTLLSRNRSLVLLATHYFELTGLAEQDPAARNMHMAVGGDGDEVVMLHRIEKGASSRSFGIQVARMAGLPKETIAQAKSKLATLERATGRTDGQGSQGSLFGAPVPQDAAPPKPNPAVEMLRNCDPDAMTPRQALELLFELKAVDDEG